MAVNSDKPQKWKNDISLSIDFYNNWFVNFAPKTYLNARQNVTEGVIDSLVKTDFLANISPSILSKYPSVLPVLRMATAPPIARDRLVGLAYVSKNLVEMMEDSTNPRIPPRMNNEDVTKSLERIGTLIVKLADRDLFSWIEGKEKPTEENIERAATVIADRLCGSISDPIIRNAQEKRQLAAIKIWLEKHDYKFIPTGTGLSYDKMKAGTFAFRLNIPTTQESGNIVNIPVDVVIMPKRSKTGDLPLLIEAKSAGDFTNTNKRRKEEAQKINQLKTTYGEKVRYVLFLCGYFDSGYLGYEAAEGIDWVWEHNIDELSGFEL